MTDSTHFIDDVFVASFNADLEILNSPARIAQSRSALHDNVVELLDDEAQFLCFMPIAATPEVIAAAYRLYGRGVRHGVRAGEAGAWAKLRLLVGASPANTAG